MTGVSSRGRIERSGDTGVPTLSFPVLIWLCRAGSRLRFGSSGAWRGVTKFFQFLLRLRRQDFFVLLQVFLSLLHGVLMMVEFLWSGEKGEVKKIVFHCFYLGSNFSE